MAHRAKLAYQLDSKQIPVAIQVDETDSIRAFMKFD